MMPRKSNLMQPEATSWTWEWDGDVIVPAGVDSWMVGLLRCWKNPKWEVVKLQGSVEFFSYARVGHCGTAFVWGFSCLDMYKASFCYGTAICFIVGFAEGRTKFCMWLTCSST